MTLTTGNAAVGSNPNIYSGLYDYVPGLILKGEVTTGDTTIANGLYAIFGIEGIDSAGNYRRHMAAFDSAALVKSEYDSYTAFTNATLSTTIKANTTYVVEVETAASSTTLYVYEKGQTRAQGWVSTRSAGAWTKVRIRAYTYQGPGRNAASASLDNVTLTKTNSTTYYTYDGINNVTQKTDAVGAQTNWIYDGIGRQTSEINPQFTDFQGTLVRPRTDKEYDGINNVKREVVRGTDNTVSGTSLSGQVETDDHITTYSYGTGGRVISETDATGAVTQYEYDTFGNIIKKTLKNRLNADGVAVDDVTTYLYDNLQHQVKSTDVTTGVISEVQYNSFGQISGKRTYTGAAPTTWQEFAEYDQAGRVWKSNSGDGVTKVYVYDRNGNATLSINGTLDMRNMTLTQVLAQKALDTQNGIASQTLYTMSVYDTRNQLIRTIQPSMESTRDVAVVQANTAGQGVTIANPTGITVASLSSIQAAINPATAGKLGVVGGTKTYTTSDRAVAILYTNGTGTGYTYQVVAVGGFPDTSAYGDGALRVEVEWYNKYVNTITGQVIGPIIPRGSITTNGNAVQFATPAYYTGLDPLYYDIIVRIYKVVNGQGEIQIAGNFVAAHGYVAAPVSTTLATDPAKKIILSGL
ncbi:MAG: RHS repeat domain-containing protein, partial [Methylotenera sp.]